jgi:hypothetical protein
MSDTTILPGGGAQVPAFPIGDGATVTTIGTQLSTDLSTAKSEPIAAFLAAGTLPIGTPIQLNAASPPAFDLAVAGAEATACPVGLLTESVIAGDPVSIRDRGLLQLTVAQWNAVVVGATTGLTPRTWYYLTATGKPISATKPDPGANTYVIALGFALTATVFKICINFQTITSS